MSIDAQILAAFHMAEQSPISGNELSKRLGVSDSEILNRINDLRSLGYVIHANPYLGYRMLKTPDILYADDLISRLGEVKTIGRRIQVFNETSSTNSIIECLANQGFPEGHVVFAESQSNGRGRFNRAWISPARKGLWFSILLRPKILQENATQITIAAATAISRAIRNETSVPAEIKWPNDILVGAKKVAGILSELHTTDKNLNYLVLGIGVNVNIPSACFPASLREHATSLMLAKDALINRPQLAAAILREIDIDYDKILNGRFEALANEWSEQCSTTGKNVLIQLGNRQIYGRAESLDKTGALLLRTAYGHLDRIYDGTIIKQEEVD
jgi:BirA family transcriptional regulator, biotin operon repressor / biotin---[acetyl-CoA-carboxylase] ligase